MNSPERYFVVVVVVLMWAFKKYHCLHWHHKFEVLMFGNPTIWLNNKHSIDEAIAELDTLGRSLIRITP